MKSEILSAITIRKLGKGDELPYDLLLDADPSRPLVDGYLPLSEIYVAQLKDMTIGTYVLFPLSHEQLEIKNIAVSEEYQGMGIGSLMLRDAMLKAKEQGFKEMIIGTGNSCIGQLYLYQKEGFDIRSIKRNFFVENYPEILYENGIQIRHMLVLHKNV